MLLQCRRFFLLALFLRFTIRDAGIMLAAYLSHVVLQPMPASSLAKALVQSKAHTPRIIELGSGCGIVGLEVAHLCPSSDVLLTDLPEAMEVLDYNVSNAKSITRTGDVTTTVLNWNRALPADVSGNHFDVVLVSDCTYNSDSIPALVNVLVALVKKSPTALVVVSMKIRHESEGIFFDLILNAGFTEMDRTAILLPDRQKQKMKQAVETVDIYVYCKDVLIREG